MEWTSEAIDTLRGLWAEGHSTAEIGRRMGVSKNAVVGKAHRLTLPARPSPIRREAEAPAASNVSAGTTMPMATTSMAPRPAAPRPAPAPREVATPRPAAPVAASPVVTPRPPVVAPPVQHRAPVLRTFPRAGARTCCWPIGEPGTPEFRFCTAEALSSKPYCSEHASVAYVRARDRREDAA